MTLRFINSLGAALLGLWVLGIRTPGSRLAAAEHTPLVEVELLSDRDHVVPGEKLRLGLLFRITPSCHIYWKNPGDAGLAPEVEWELPPGFVAGPLFWPAPERLEEPGHLYVNTYMGEVLLFSWVQAPAGLNVLSVTLKARAKWLVCRKICVQEQAEARLTLAAGTGPAAPGAGQEKIEYYGARVPRPVEDFPALRLRAGWDDRTPVSQDTRIGMIVLESVDQGSYFLTAVDQLQWFDKPSDILNTEDYHLDAANSRSDRVILHLRVRKIDDNSAWPAGWGGVLTARLVDEKADTLDYPLTVDFGD